MDEGRSPAAALYNVLWGAFVVLFPFALFGFLGMGFLNHPEIWQCVGMIAVVYASEEVPPRVLCADRRARYLKRPLL